MNRADTVLDRWELCERVLRHDYKAQQKIEDRSSPWSLTMANSPGIYYVTFRPVRWRKEMPTPDQVLEMLNKYARWGLVVYVGAASWEKNKKGEEIPTSWHWMAFRSTKDEQELATQKEI